MFVDNFKLTKIACKLPNSLCDKWVRYSRDKRLKYQHPPELSDFVTFVEKEADIACDIMNNYQLDKVDNRLPRVHSHAVNTSLSENSTALSINSKNSREHSHVVEIPMNENVTASSSKLSCLLCKDSHLLDHCPEFLKKSVKDRVQYVFRIDCVTHVYRLVIPQSSVRSAVFVLCVGILILLLFMMEDFGTIPRNLRKL